MKNVKIVIAVIAMICIGGCGGETASFLGGAAAGGALSNTFAGAQADLEAAKQQKIADLEKANQELDNATTEVEKIAAQAKITALEKKVQDLSDLQIGVALADEGTKVDWTDPAAIGGYGSTLLTSLLAIYFRRKQTTESKKRSAEKVGREKTMNELESLPEDQINASLVKKILFSNIGEERGRQNVA